MVVDVLVVDAVVGVEVVVAVASGSGWSQRSLWPSAVRSIGSLFALHRAAG